MQSIYQYYNLEQIQNKKVVCFGCLEAQEFALRLLGQDICFDYFLYLGDEDYCLPHFMNKQIINIEQLKLLDRYVVVASYRELEHAYQIFSGTAIEQHIVAIERIHPLISNASNLVIYGTGTRAGRVFESLYGYADVKMFCDSNQDKAGTSFQEKKVIHVSELSDYPKDTCIIIGSTYYDEIRDTLRQYGVDEKYVFYAEYGLTLFSNDGYKVSYPIKSLLDLIQDCKNKQIAIYGESGIVNKMSKIFSNLNIEVQVSLGRDGFEENGTIYSLAYYDLQNVICIMTDSYTSAAHDALEQMGLRETQLAWIENYNSFSVSCTDRAYNCVLDPHLGHAHIKDGEEYSGFVKYENITFGDSAPFIILALGGSTTSGYGVRQKPWSEYLSDMLAQKCINHVIYCGGTDSYTASQELIKLIRDGIWLKPDCVISYSGINNMSIFSKVPFVHYYQKELYDSLNHSIASSHWGKMRGVNYGVQPDCDSFEFWFSQIKMMRAVCDSLDIDFKAFLQPTLCSKKKLYKGDEDLDVMFLNGYGIIKENGKETWIRLKAEGADPYGKIIKNAYYFRESVKKVNEAWFYDLSDLFDGIGGIYIDPCHVRGEGNNMIAGKIYEAIQNDLKQR